MSVCTTAKLKGYVPAREIAEFLEKNGITKTARCEIDANKIHDTEVEKHGFLLFDHNDIGRTLFYYNLSKKTEDGYQSKDTTISISCSEEHQNIVKKIVEEFGGYYQKNDCSGKPPVRIQGRLELERGFAIAKRVDIFLDIETFGTGEKPPVFQISAVAYDRKNDVELATFNNIADISKMKNINGDTLKWWLETAPDVLLKLLNSATVSSEKELVEMFSNWIVDIQEKVGEKNVFLWGNGMLFDNRIIKEKCAQYLIEYPIFYRCDRDLRTLFEIAAEKLELADGATFYRSINFTGDVHDALADTKHNLKCYKVAIREIFAE